MPLQKDSQKENTKRVIITIEMNIKIIEKHKQGSCVADIECVQITKIRTRSQE